MANIVTLGRGQQAVTGLPIGKLNDLDRRISVLESGSSGGSGGAILIEVPEGDMGQNVFTVVNRPKMVDVDGTLYYEGLQYTYSSGTITIDDANYSTPENYIRSLYNATETKVLSYSVGSPTSSLTWGLGQFPNYATTITKIKAYAIGGTSVTFNIQERAETTPNSAGTNIMTSSLVADSDGAETTTFSNAGIAAYAHLFFVASAMSGTVTSVQVTIEYTID